MTCHILDEAVWRNVEYFLVFTMGCKWSQSRSQQSSSHTLAFLWLNQWPYSSSIFSFFFRSFAERKPNPVPEAPHQGNQRSADIPWSDHADHSFQRPHSQGQICTHCGRWRRKAGLHINDFVKYCDAPRSRFFAKPIRKVWTCTDKAWLKASIVVKSNNLVKLLDLEASSSFTKSSCR